MKRIWDRIRRRKVWSLDDATRRAVERTGPRELCNCLTSQHAKPGKWIELKFHADRPKEDCPAWLKLLDLVEEAARDGRTVFEPGADLTWEEWTKITTLPASIGKLKKVRSLLLYGSNLSSIPPQIGEMTGLEYLDLYTSYRLHWLPYELTRCRKLRDSRISTRALYGNYKYRPPFPRLRPSSRVLSRRPAAFATSRLTSSRAINHSSFGFPFSSERMSCRFWFMRVRVNAWSNCPNPQRITLPNRTRAALGKLSRRCGFRPRDPPLRS